MSDDQLRLIAEIVDRFSAPARELRAALANVQSDQRKTQEEQTKHTEKFQQQIRETTRLFREGLGPVLKDIGIGVGSFGAALLGVEKATFGMAESVRKLNALSAQTGTNIQSFREMEVVMGRVGIGAEAADASFKVFSDRMVQLKYQSGDFYNFLAARPITAALRADLTQTKTAAEAAVAVLKHLMTDPALQIPGTFKSELLGAAGLPPELLAIKDFAAELKRAHELVIPFSKQAIEDADRLNRSWQDVVVTADQYKNKIGEIVSGPMASLLESTEKWLLSLTAGDRKLGERIQGPTGAFGLPIRPPPSGVEWLKSPGIRLPGAPMGLMTPQRGGTAPNPFDLLVSPAEGAELQQPHRGANMPLFPQGYVPDKPMEQPRLGQPLTAPGATPDWIIQHGKVMTGEEAKKITKEGTHEGVLEALREFSTESGGGGGGGGGGDSGYRFGGSTPGGGKGLPGSPGAWIPHGGVKPSPTVRSSSLGDGVNTGKYERFGVEEVDLDWYNKMKPQGEEALYKARESFNEELKDPALRDLFAARMASEVGGQGPVAAQKFGEEVMNRALARGQTLRTALEGKPESILGGKGYYPTVMTSGRVGPDARLRFNDILDKAKRSNLIKFGTGNASQGVGFGRRGFETSRMGPGGPGDSGASIGISDFFASRGGHSIGKVNVPGMDPEFSSRLQRAAQDYERITGRKADFGEISRGWDKQQEYYEEYLRTGEGLAAPPGRSRHGLATGSQAADIPTGPFRDWIRSNAGRYGLETIGRDIPHIQMNREVPRGLFGKVGDLTAAAKEANMGPGPVKVEGGAKLDVNFRNQPPGTSAWLEHFGVFDKAEINRGKTMEKAAD